VASVPLVADQWSTHSMWLLRVLTGVYITTDRNNKFQQNLFHIAEVNHDAMASPICDFNSFNAYEGTNEGFQYPFA
jgi:hypothetical protein